MALLALYNDVSLLDFVQGLRDPDPAVLPTLKQEDILHIEYQALKPTQNPLAPYSLVALTGYSLTISVGPVGAPVAQQSSFTLAADGYTLVGSLSLNTAGFSALTDGSSTLFEATLMQGSTAVMRTQRTLTVRKSVYVAAALVPIAGDTALGRFEADRLYLRKDGANGEAWLSRSADGTKSNILYTHDDGSFRIEPIT